MIVVSLLLILVAVTLLVLGLTGGSSDLLISSIVASLVAAVFLVIGARQAAAARRAASAAPKHPDDSAFASDPEFAAVAVAASRRRDPDDFPPPGASFEANPERSESGLGEDRRETVPLDTGDVAAGRPPADSATINAARSGPPDADTGPGETPAAEFAEPVVVEPVEPVVVEPAEPAEPAEFVEPVEPAEFVEPVEPAEFVEPAEPAEPAEFAEPDVDDPDDEPLPQAVQPADAVRVSRLEAEVMVVDGRPRYHLPECPSLVGRLAEPVPVREAVELGFNPCGLCRPVDRLVGSAARR